MSTVILVLLGILIVIIVLVAIMISLNDGPSSAYQRLRLWWLGTTVVLVIGSGVGSGAFMEWLPSQVDWRVQMEEVLARALGARARGVEEILLP